MGEELTETRLHVVVTLHRGWFALVLGIIIAGTRVSSACSSWYVPVPVHGCVVGRWMGENGWVGGWVTRYCTPVVVQSTHDCVFR